MVATQREVEFEHDAGIRIRWRRSESPPPYTYAVTVEVRSEDASWATVRLWDNADDVDEHHMHEYTRRDGKQKPMIRSFDSINEAMAAAITEARRNAAEIVRQWERS
jgi:hypothetical protein